MNNTICFIANFYKTPTFKAIADNLATYDVKTCWIVPNKNQYDELVKVYGEGMALLIDRSYVNTPNEPVGDFKLNEIVFGDLRVWRHSMDEGLKYLTNIQRPVYDFLKKNDIHLVFGEDTWGQELLIHRMCNQLPELKCCYYSQMVARIPNGKFFFFYDEKQAEFVPVKNTGEHVVQAIKVEKPEYLAINDRLLKNAMSLRGNMNRAKRFFTNENIHPTDPNVETKRGIRFKVATREVVNQHTYKYLHRESPDCIEGKKFVLFGFHKQPEASIDVCGRYFENQYENVLNIWRQLPPDWYLVIKEHSNAIGDRSYKFLNSLRKYPRIIIMNEHASAQELMKKCQLVVTNTGTMALEAALQGIPAITLSRVMFNCLNYCRHCTWQDFEKYDSLEQLIDEIKSKPQNNDDYAKLVEEYAFDGILTDLVTMPEVLNEENVTDLVNSFLALVDFNNKRLAL